MHMPEGGFLLPNRAAHPQLQMAPAAAASGERETTREDMSLIDDLVELEEEAKELVAGADDAANSRLRALSCSAARAASPA